MSSEPTQEAYKAAENAAWPGLPEGMPWDQAQRRARAAARAVWPLAVAAARAKVAEEIREFGEQAEDRAAQHYEELSGSARRANAAVSGAFEMAAMIATGTNRRNTHCVRCGDLRGGPMGHEVSECTWVRPEHRIATRVARIAEGGK